MSDLTYWILWAFLAIIIIIGVWWVLTTILNPAHGQETTTKAPPAVTPTPVNTPTPTEPNPNLQYLPQKAYVQAYAPEVGIPTGQQPLQVVPQVVPVQPSQSIQNNLLDSVGGIAGVMGVLAAAGTYVKAHFIGKSNKETMAAEVKTKEQVHELARVTYENMPQKGNEITDAPAIKLETLKEDKQEFTDKAAKA